MTVDHLHYLGFYQVVWCRLIKSMGGRVALTGSVKSLSESDAVLDIGGLPFLMGGLIFLPYNILTLWPAILLKVPVIKMSQAAGLLKIR